MNTKKKNGAVQSTAFSSSHQKNMVKTNNYQAVTQDKMDCLSDFKIALDKAGLHTKEKLIADGEIHRIHIEGDRKGSKNGWYVIYDGYIQAGAFGSWKIDQTHTWCEKGIHELTLAQRQQHTQRMRGAQQAREAKELKRRQDAQNRSSAIWEAALMASLTHPYLVKKKVKNYGLRQHNGRLVIPMRDGAGVLCSLQFIDNGGNKRFLSGGRKKGCYFLIGDTGKSLLIAEGYATAATLREVTGQAVAVAFDAGNLKPVAQVLRGQFPNVKITICADNDTKTEINIGVEKARVAAVSIDAFLAIPSCAGDFNDLLTGALR